MAVYAVGYNIKYNGSITTDTIVRLIDALQEEFGPGYVFTPEAITEGGLEMIEWPGPHEKGAYKSVRFNMYGVEGEWPWIEAGTTLNEWRSSKPPKLIWGPRKGSGIVQGQLFYKALYGATGWTQEELRFLKNAFQRIGFQCSDSA